MTFASLRDRMYALEALGKTHDDLRVEAAESARDRMREQLRAVEKELYDYRLDAECELRALRQQLRFRDRQIQQLVEALARGVKPDGPRPVQAHVQPVGATRPAHAPRVRFPISDAARGIARRQRP